jgi:hypothetical protein
MYSPFGSMMATNRDAPDSASIRESSVFTSADLPCPGDPKIAMLGLVTSPFA